MKTIPFRKKVRIVLTTLFLILFPAIFYYLSPVIPLAAASVGFVSGSLIIFGALFLFSLFFGRLFCSYVCPGGTIQDQVRKAKNRAFPRKYFNWIKYLIWVPWIVTLAYLFARSGGIQKISFTFQTDHGLSVSDISSLIIYLLVALVFFILPLIFGRRAACHTICWMAPFMILGKKVGKALHLPSLHISSNIDSCISCKKCTDSCPMSLPVEVLQKGGTIHSSDCILCGECVDVCPTNTLSFSFRSERTKNNR
jgi:polyferredoxin